MARTDRVYDGWWRSTRDLDEMIDDVEESFEAVATPVHTGHWQGLNVEGRPDFETLELTDQTFRVRWVPYTVDKLRYQCRPSLPWADEHFEERVSRVPSNPGESYKNWPWYSPGADETARSYQGPDVDERDWAYLAALIDGDGSISFKDNSGTATRTATSGKYRISIGQKDGEFLRQVSSKFPGLGIVRTRQSPSKCGNFMSDWSISRKQDLLWCLPRVIPYLILKQDKAKEALEWTVAKGVHGSDSQVDRPRLFSHTYQERFWGRGFGERYPFGNLDSLINLLLEHPYTRQAYLPIFSREDTGAVHGGRIPCSIGYQFMLRDDCLHMWYVIRSCDLIRHFRDDVYLACRLLLWVLYELKDRAAADGSDFWESVTPGSFTMHCFSLHAHKGDLHAPQS